MIAFPTLLTNVLLFALLILPGFVLGKWKKIEKNALTSMTNILMYVAMPFLVFSKLLVTDLRTISPTAIALCVLFPIVIIAVIYAVSLLLFKKKDGDTRFRANRFCAVFSNCGFLGIPLAEVLFPSSPQIAVYVSLFNVTSTFLLLTFGVYVLSGDKRDISFRRACISPIAISIVLGVIGSLCGVASLVPQVGTYANILANLTTPLSMLVLGVELSALRLSALVRTAALYPVALLKLVLSPLLTVAILFALSVCGLSFSPEVMAALFIATAVSTAASAPAMSKKYGVDGEHAAVLTLGTTVLCTVVLPLLYMLFELILL